jgi:hypothetical protein
MPFSIDDLIDKHDKHFNEWIDKLNKHSELWYSDNTFSQDENIKIVTDVVGVLAKICEIFYQYGNFKDVFENDNFYQHVCGPELIINTKKNQIEL